MEGDAGGIDHSLLSRLIDWGLVEAADVVDGDLLLRDLSRRNANVLVERRGAAVHFVKRAVTTADRANLEREAARYADLTEAGLAHLAPAMRLHDGPTGTLVVEGLAGARDLRTVHHQEQDCPPEIGALLGEALGHLHDGAAGGSGAGPATPPWTLSLHRPTVDALGRLTPAGLEATRAIQVDVDLTRRLDELRDEWAPRTTVHGDVKWDNVLLLTDRDGAPSSVRLVDWEHSAQGDPLWDVGSALAGYLSMWVFSIDASPGGRPEDLPSLARRPLEGMSPALVALWEAYLAARGLDDPDGRLVAHAVEMAGVRLLLTAHEATESGGDLTPHLVLHLQLAANLIVRPRDSLGALGLPAGGS